MKKLLFALVFSILLFGLNFSSIGSSVVNEVKVIVNKNAVISGARIIDDRVYLPVRSVSEALGADVTWDGNSKTVNIDMQSQEEYV